MGMLTRAPDTPERAVAWFARHDVAPVASRDRHERRRLVAAVSGLWVARSKAERYDAARRVRLAAVALECQGGPIASRAADAATVIDFLWEREYGVPTSGFAAGWEPLSVREMAQVAAVFAD